VKTDECQFRGKGDRVADVRQSQKKGSAVREREGTPEKSGWWGGKVSRSIAEGIAAECCNLMAGSQGRVFRGSYLRGARERGADLREPGERDFWKPEKPKRRRGHKKKQEERRENLL